MTNGSYHPSGQPQDDLDSPLAIALDLFMAAMLDKFRLRAHRRMDSGEKSVTDMDYDWKDLNLESIESHLYEEVQERTEATDEDSILDEDVDIANMAFLDYIGRTYRRK